MQQPLGFHISTDEPDLTLKDACERAACAGYDGIELRLGSGVPRDTPGAQSWLDEQFAVAVAANATVLAVAADCPSTTLDDAIELVHALLQGAAACQARCLNVTIPPLRRCAGVPPQLGPCLTEEHPSVPAPVPEFAFVGYQDALNFAYRLLCETRYEAESTGVPLALEAASGGCLVSPVELRETIDAANSWAVGVCLDTDRVASVGSPTDWLVTLNRRVRCIRVPGSASFAPLNPVSAVSPGRRPSQGLAELLAAIEETSYAGPIIVLGRGGSDPPGAEAFRARWRGSVARNVTADGQPPNTPS